MSPAIVVASERPDLAARMGELGAAAWPEYNKHGDVLNLYWGRLGEVFADFQFVLFDEDAGAVLAEGYSIPCRWDGTPDALPDGIDAVIADGFRLRERGDEPDALSALAIVVAPERQGGGLSSVMVEAMAEIGARHGLANLIAPVRPSWKERYPLAPIERYASWTREDGLPFDPWLRTHVRLGGEILRPAPRSLRITGAVAEWASWTEMAFPESGTYVFPRGLAPLEIDREEDVGSYWEPNVWVRHLCRKRPSG